MASSFQMALAVTASYQAAADLGATAALSLPYSSKTELGDGSGAGKADRMYAKTRTLTASSTEDLDLAAVLTDIFGTTLTFVRVKGLFVKAAKTNTNNVVVGAAATNQWATLLNTTGTVTLRPGTWFGACCDVTDATGYAVTAGVGDLLKVANSAGGTSVSYDIIVIGNSA
jgi:hypothetical protein